MLRSIRMKNIALIDELTLSFEHGMYAFTGETGAGKSIIVDAVNLVLGGRADRELIRTGENKASVEAIFDIKNSSSIGHWLDEQQIESDDHLVTLYREISLTGRNVCRICGIMVSVNTLKELSAMLMDVYGQHENRFLINPKYHLDFLDSSGDSRHQELLAQTTAAYNEFIECHHQYLKLVRDSNQKKAQLDGLKHALEELRKADLKNGEEEVLTQERQQSRENEKIANAINDAFACIASGEGEIFSDSIKSAASALQTIECYRDEYKSLASRCSSVFYELQEISYELSLLKEKIEFDPLRMEFVENRLDLIHRLEKKYGSSVHDVLIKKAELEEEYERFESIDQELAATASRDRSLLTVYRNAAKSLSQSRHEIARRFESDMQHELSELGMEHTVFQVKFIDRMESKPSMPRAIGDDDIEFLISPNPGEPLKPLARIASGGELSRLMLAVKTLEAEHGGVDTMVFDEIDTGISGRIAQIVGEKMACLSKHKQVLCVTHLPQIAAISDHQFLVEKKVDNSHTNTFVHLLTSFERIDEIARMLGGVNGVDDSAKRHAAHMLSSAASHVSISESPGPQQ